MIGIAEIEAARRTLEGVLLPTPTLVSPHLSEEIGARISLKAESLQRAGSFKLRGAYNKLSGLTEAERRAGVVAASMGNHAQGVALAARLLGIDATIVMPESAPLAKITATRRYGAAVILRGQSFDDAIAHAEHLRDSQGMTLVHAFDDPAIIAGQGTIGLEILEALPDVGTVIVPIGGGGLISGIATAIHAARPDVRIVGVQAAGCAAIEASLAAGEPITIPHASTIADGIAIKRPGGITLPLIREHVAEIATVEEDEIAHAIMYLLQTMKLQVEGAGAVGVAALLTHKIVPKAGEQVCAILSGGNIDPILLSRVIEQELVRNGRYLVLRSSVPDRPGNLAGMTEQIAAAGANVIDIMHRRAAWGVPLDRTGLEMILEVRDQAHGEAVIERLREHGYHVSAVGRAEYEN
jgi:threonine dehydratase